MNAEQSPIANEELAQLVEEYRVLGFYPDQSRFAQALEASLLTAKDGDMPVSYQHSAGLRFNRLNALYNYLCAKGIFKLGSDLRDLRIEPECDCSIGEIMMEVADLSLFRYADDDVVNSQLIPPFVPASDAKGLWGILNTLPQTIETMEFHRLARRLVGSFIRSH